MLHKLKLTVVIVGLVVLSIVNIETCGYPLQGVQYFISCTSAKPTLPHVTVQSYTTYGTSFLIAQKKRKKKHCS